MESADETSAWHRVSANVKPVTASKPPAATLKSAVRLRGEKLLNPDALTLYGGIATRAAVLVILAAGTGTSFGAGAKCVQPVRGTPLARHSIDAFRRLRQEPSADFRLGRGRDSRARR
jgi:hypothetical protein